MVRVGEELAAQARGVAATAGGGVNLDVAVEFRARVGWAARCHERFDSHAGIGHLEQ